MTEPLQSGQRLGAYRIIRPLGGGGMGQVYEAEHVGLGVRRALKVFTTESHHIDFLRKRFIAEGRILADLDHPRIVHVYDLVVDDETGTPYFAMDLVLSPDGTPRTLENEREAGVSEEKVAMWFKDICEGLAYVHSHKVVHRDISLDNILIGPDGHAVISDFGIAKIVDDNYRRKINVTVTMASNDAKDLCMGKGNYMAPELKRGGKETPASDAYALGVVLFRLLTGFWYEPNRLEKTKDLLAGFEYDWVSLIVKLCAANPQFRLTDEESIGIAATLKLPRLEHVHIPFWKSSKFKAIVVLAATGFLGGIYYLPKMEWLRKRVGPYAFTFFVFYSMPLVILLVLMTTRLSENKTREVGLARQREVRAHLMERLSKIRSTPAITNVITTTNVVQTFVVKTNVVELTVRNDDKWKTEVEKERGAQLKALQAIQAELKRIKDLKKQQGTSH